MLVPGEQDPAEFSVRDGFVRCQPQRFALRRLGLLVAALAVKRLTLFKACLLVAQPR